MAAMVPSSAKVGSVLKRAVLRKLDVETHGVGGKFQAGLWQMAL
jgi:hypothetical protein